jgi:histone H1/5
MPPKRAAATAAEAKKAEPVKKAAAPKPKATLKKSAPSDHPKYQDMIKSAVVALKERNGSSRQAIKKYILATYKVEDSEANNSLINRAIKTGVEKGVFSQPKGASGPVKLAKKDAEKKTTEKAPPKSKPAEKKATTKKTTTKKSVPKTKAAKAKTTEKAGLKAKKPAAKKSATKSKKAATKASKPKKAASKK